MNSIDAQRATAILRLFRNRKDTAEIANILKIPESKVSRLLWFARSQEKGLPAHYLNPARQVREFGSVKAA